MATLSPDIQYGSDHIKSDTATNPTIIKHVGVLIKKESGEMKFMVNNC